MGRFRGTVALLAVLALVRVLAMLATPATLATAIDAVGRPARLTAALLGLGAALTLAALADTGENLAGAYCGSRMTAWLRHRVTRRVLELGVPGRRRFPTGDVLSRLTENASSPATFPVLLVTGVATLLTGLGAVVALALIDVWLALALLLGVIPAVALLRAFTVTASEPFADYQRAQAAIATRLLDARQGIRTIRASGTMPREVERILGPLSDLRAAGWRTWTVQRRVSWRLSLLVPSSQVVVVAVAGVRLAAGAITTGDLVAAASYTALAAGSASLFDTLVALLTCQIGAGRVAELLDAPGAVTPPEQPIHLAGGAGGAGDVGGAGGVDGVGGAARAGEVRLRDVTVRIDGRTVLDRLNLRVPAGSSVAIVGASGSGKSLLVATVGRLIDPQQGSVEIDGVPVDRLAPRDLRRVVAYAFERPAPLGVTMHDTIAYARPEATRAQVREAARIADADAFIRTLPDGYDTPLAAAPLSGGEHQRLGLARAALTGARVYLLDDATSSLDTVTEMRVTQALSRILDGHTCLLVARRPATAARADLVAWLEDGRIRDLAPHAVLWNEPAYREVFTADRAPDAAPGSDAAPGFDAVPGSDAAPGSDAGRHR